MEEDRARTLGRGPAGAELQPPLEEFEPASIQAAVFDLGGVLIEGGPSDVRALGARVGMAPEAWERLRAELFSNEGTWARLERGETSLETFSAELETRIERAGGSITSEQARSFMGESLPMSSRTRLRTEMVDAVRRLKRRMPTAMLTNNVREWRNGWKGALGTDELFNVVVDSSEVGTRKPETQIYEITRRRLGVPHQSIFFVDDIGQNLKAARRLGWQTLRYTDSSAALAVIERIIEAR